MRKKVKEMMRRREALMEQFEHEKRIERSMSRKEKRERRMPELDKLVSKNLRTLRKLSPDERRLLDEYEKKQSKSYEDMRMRATSHKGKRAVFHGGAWESSRKKH